MCKCRNTFVGLAAGKYVYCLANILLMAYLTTLQVVNNHVTIDFLCFVATTKYTVLARPSHTFQLISSLAKAKYG